MINDKILIKTALEKRDWSKAALGRKVGRTQANMQAILDRPSNGMRTDIFVSMMEAMGYEIIIKDKITGKVFGRLETLDKDDAE